MCPQKHSGSRRVNGYTSLEPFLAFYWVYFLNLEQLIRESTLQRTDSYKRVPFFSIEYTGRAVVLPLASALAVVALAKC